VAREDAPPFGSVAIRHQHDNGGDRSSDRTRDTADEQAERCVSDNRAEARRRYSNPPGEASDQVGRLRQLLQLVAANTPDMGAEAPKQLQRRLRAHQVSELVALYDTGSNVSELAKRYGCHRDTVSKLLDRAGASCRQRGVPPDRVQNAIRAYVDGASLATIGAELSVDPMTVARMLRANGVQIRPRPGWPRGA